MNFKNNFLCISNASSHSRNKFFNVEKFNQINYWRTRILKTNEIFKKDNIDKELSIISKYKKYINSKNNILVNKNETNKNKNNEKINSLRKTINIKKINRNKMLIESKTIDENLDKYKYKLIQFNLNRLIKPSLKYKNKEVLNTKDLLTPIIGYNSNNISK
jgi:predicted double-glycine peptidase